MPRKRRSSQRDLYPSSVKARQLGPVIRRVNFISRAISSTVANGKGVTFVATVSSNRGARILVSLDRATYVGSVSAANELPGGADVTESNYHVVGPFKSSRRSDGKNEVEVLHVENNSGSDKIFISDIQARYIVNEGGTTS